MRLHNLLEKLSLPVEGLDDFEVRGLNTLQDATAEELSFLDNPKYLPMLEKTKAGAVFIAPQYAKTLPDGVPAIVTEEPYLKMAETSYWFRKPLIRQEAGAPKIAASARIGDNVHIGHGAVIGEDVTILSGAVIGEEVEIGEGSIIYPNVTLYNDVKIGKRVTIHAGSVVGSDGFGYAHTRTGEHVKIYHNGSVIIEEDVEIGANTTIDRAVFGATRIKKGAKIDNLIQIGHNCEIGEHSILVSQVGLSGSTKLGRNVVMGGQSATSGHLEIGDFVTIAARGGVTKSVKTKDVYSGFPLMRHKDWLRLQAKLAKLLKSS
ncbi:MAG TPA: UDP-3-O-(3-hydroxymyristoyl)glucosamine N-acyltransferase [Campylobacteraceae bacterium]|nr:UDP-3-O-(3-hydroxymyristoyl)glucosamine N-acyltransferase [Campylobacteraceae bacterium]